MWQDSPEGRRLRIGLDVLLFISDWRLSALVEREAPDLNVFRLDEDPRRVKKRFKRGREGVDGVSSLDGGTEGRGCEFMSDDIADPRPKCQNRRILPTVQLHF